MSSSELPTPPRTPVSRTGNSRRAPRQRGLSRDAIVDAALAIVDRDGLDALTMRSVAQALGTGAASLYAHVSSKDELLEMLIERVIGEIDFPENPDPERWVEQVKDLMREMKEMWERHRDLARASFARIPLGENALRGSEKMIALMRAGGLSDIAIGLGSDLLALYVGAIAYEGSLMQLDAWTPEQIGAFIAELRDYFASLPVDRFPNVVSLAGPMTEADGDARFEFGIEVLIRGLIAVSADG